MILSSVVLMYCLTCSLIYCFCEDISGQKVKWSTILYGGVVIPFKVPFIFFGK